jgi:hypothetical protein
VKIAKVILSAAIVAAFLSAAAFSQTAEGNAASDAPAQHFLGRWDLKLIAPDHQYPSWLQVQQKDGQLTALFVGRWGSARPLPRIEISGRHITFVSPKEEEGAKTDMVFQGTLTGARLSGTVNAPDGTSWKWLGERAPELEDASEPQWGKPIRLFNGKNLSGWRMDKPGPPDWTVENGVLVSPGHGPELINDRKFRDFKLHIEFNCNPDSNSGVYLRGRYEVQVETDSVSEPPSHHTGAVYGFIAPSPELPRTPDVWQTFDITLIGRRVTVVQNGHIVIDHQEIPGITGGALSSDEAASGPIYLQGSEKGHVRFRNIVITPAQ